MTETGIVRPSPPCVVISSCPCCDDNDDDPDDESDDDNDDDTQPSAHHHRDVIAYLPSLRRMRHTSLIRCVLRINITLNKAHCPINRFSVDWSTGVRW